jgi:hypothetical protein
MVIEDGPATIWTSSSSERFIDADCIAVEMVDDTPLLSTSAPSDGGLWAVAERLQLGARLEEGTGGGAIMPLEGCIWMRALFLGSKPEDSCSSAGRLGAGITNAELVRKGAFGGPSDLKMSKARVLIFASAGVLVLR